MQLKLLLNFSFNDLPRCVKDYATHPTNSQYPIHYLDSQKETTETVLIMVILCSTEFGLIIVNNCNQGI